MRLSNPILPLLFLSLFGIGTAGCATHAVGEPALRDARPVSTQLASPARSSGPSMLRAY